MSQKFKVQISGKDLFVHSLSIGLSKEGSIFNTEKEAQKTKDYFLRKKGLPLEGFSANNLKIVNVSEV